MEFSFGESRELVRFKDVMVVAQECCLGFGVEVDIHLAVLHIVEGANIVEATDMVAVGVGDENGIKMVDLVAEHLLPEVGSDVEENVDRFIG